MPEHHHAPDPHSAPDFDPEPIRQLLVDLADPEGVILPELESGFHVQALEQLADLGSSLAASDLPKAAKIAHALKGQCLTLGLMALAEASIALEQHAKAGDVSACQRLGAEIPIRYERAQVALSQHIHGRFNN